MDDKRAHEQYRVQQFSGPHPALDTSAAAALDEDWLDVEPDTSRVVLHFDCDAFYAQVEEVRNPALRDVPLGVTQKYLIVTCNYPARRAGITKLMGITEAKAKCPELVLVSGEDLTPYRCVSLAHIHQSAGICSGSGS